MSTPDGSGGAVGTPGVIFHFPTGPAIWPQAVALVVLSGLAVILDISPLIWHAKSRNYAMCALLGWIGLINFISFINVIIWPNDDINNQYNGKGLCDVEVRLQVASYFGTAGSIAAILRNLAAVMDTRKLTLVPTTKQKRINAVITGFLCFGFPIIGTALQYIVQNTRYYLFTISGCTPGLDNSWLGIVLNSMWPILLSLLAVFYATLLCIRIHRYKSDFNTLITFSKTTKSRFLRLFTLSAILVLILLPVQIYIFVTNVSFGILPYHWIFTHRYPYWGQVQVIPTFGKVLMDRWINVALGFLAFAAFGIGNDALDMYKGWAVALGLGKVFPVLTRDRNDRKQKNGWTFGMGTWASLNDRARQLLRKKKDTEGHVEESMPRSSVSTFDPTGTSGSAKEPADFVSGVGNGPHDVSVSKEAYISVQPSK